MKGLITEASPLTYPENASIDESNTVLFQKGNRSRRYGIDLEPEYSLDPFTYTASEVQMIGSNEFLWKNPGNSSSFVFIVIQIGLKILFYNTSSVAKSNGLDSFSIDLTPYIIPSSDTTTARNSRVSFDAGRGILFVSGPVTEPFLVEFDPVHITFSVTRIYIQIRDFVGVNDGLANDEEPTSLSTLHQYNLMNQGWVNPQNIGSGFTNVTYYGPFGEPAVYTAPDTAPITQFFDKEARYPGNNKQWWVAKAAVDDNTVTPHVKAGDFLPDLLTKSFSGNTRAPRGHFVVNPFDLDRSSVSGVIGIPVEVINNRPVDVSFFSGRVWYVLDNKVYFSQLLTDKSKAGLCYQEADPTSETISDLIATDGGVVPIPDMADGKRLLPVGSGILVFGGNGVWYITGTTAGFSASDISVSKISSLGVLGPNSVIEVDGTVFWWSELGIQAMTPKAGLFGPIGGSFDKLSLSDTTIKTLYISGISDPAKNQAKAVYDIAHNTIRWLYSSNLNNPTSYYDSILSFDISLQAFFPWTISSTFGTTPFVFGAVSLPKTLDDIRDTFIQCVIAVPQLDGSYRWTFGTFTDKTFVDWKSFDGTGQNYLSYVETGYELLEDALRKKQTPYVRTYFTRTEQNYIPDGFGDYIFDSQSSCLFTTKWDWASAQSSGKFSRQVEAYILGRVPEFDESNLVFDYGFPVVTRRHKVRGSGKAIQFRFESNGAGKDFDLLGWAVEYSGNTNP